MCLKKNSSTDVKGPKIEQFVDRIQHHPLAPTLPTHSPLLTDDSTIQLFSKAKLSARYINNSNNLLYSKSSNVKDDYSKTVTDKFVKSQPTITSSSSKLLCHCEKSCLESSTYLNKSKKHTLDSLVGKRLVPTRNAATSPHLDIRKLDSLTKLSPSQKNIASEKQNDTKKWNNKVDTVEKNKKPLEKNYSLEETKSFKQLKSTRSLSPKPPLYHQYTMLLSDSNHDSKDVKLSDSSMEAKQQINKICRSEQSSPNVVDCSENKFTYKGLTNRSRSCLGGNVFFDPWLRNACLTNISTSIVKNDRDRESSENLKKENSKDPWVKRTDIRYSSKADANEFFQQYKSFSTSKFDVKSNTCLLNRSKVVYLLKEDIKSSPIIEVKKQLQSAPTSPLFLTGTGNNLTSSSSCLSNQFNIVENTPTRSASFSPARIKDGYNPFNNYTLSDYIPCSPPPSISVASAVINDQNVNKFDNYESLNVYNPHFLNTRHSFSSVSEKNKTEELQLNIRRLSDQMRKKESVIVKSIKAYSSDHNAESNKNDIRKQDIYNKNITKSREATNRADFSEYLEQFRCSEAKKAVIDRKDNFKISNSLNNESRNNEIRQKNKQPQQSANSPLETTC